jgi:sugar (pentulose or hexulose) kinase
MMKILALDVGTSAVKAAVLNAEKAEPVGPVHHVAYELDHPTPDAAEIQPERLWEAVTGAARSATRWQEGVAGVGLACLTPALVLLGADDQPLGPIWTHLDRRARPAARQVWAAVGPEFLATTGNRPLPGGISAVCYRQQVTDDPYLQRRVRCYLHVNGWLALRFTGERAFDPANASFSGLFGTLTDQQWSRRWCDFFDVDPAWLPPVVCGSTTLGPLRSAVAAELGVPPGVEVKLGTADTSSAVLAAGMGPFDLLHEVGTTQVLAALTDRPAPDPKRLTRLLGVGKTFLSVAHNPVGGVALEWLRHLCFRELPADDFYGQAIQDALQRSTRVTLDPPYLGGDRLEIEAHRAAFRDLELSTDRLDLLAALLHEMRRQHEKAVRALGKGDSFSRVFLTGGGADVVRRLIPAYADLAVHSLDEGSLRGVARLWSSPH